MKIEDAAGHRICAFWKKFNDAARLTVVRKKSDVSHLSDLCDGTDKGERHLPVWPRLAVTRKQIDLVGLFRVFLLALRRAPRTGDQGTDNIPRNGDESI